MNIEDDTQDTLIEDPVDGLIEEDDEEIGITNVLLEDLITKVNYQESIVAYKTNNFDSKFIFELLNLFKKYPNEAVASKLSPLLPIVPLLDNIASDRLKDLVKIGAETPSSLLLDAIAELKKRAVKNPMVPLHTLRKDGFTISFIEGGCRAENDDKDYVEWKTIKDRPQLSYRLGGKEKQFEGSEFELKLATMAFIECRFNTTPTRVQLVSNFVQNSSKFFPGYPAFSNFAVVFKEVLKIGSFSGCRQYADCFNKILHFKVPVETVKKFEQLTKDVMKPIDEKIKFVRKYYSGNPTKTLVVESAKIVPKVTTTTLDPPKTLRGNFGSLSNSLFKSFEYERSPATPGVSTYHKWLNVVEKIKNSKFFEGVPKENTFLISFGHTKENHWEPALAKFDIEERMKFDIKPVTTDVNPGDIFTYDLDKTIEELKIKEGARIVFFSDIQKDGDTSGEEMSKLIVKYQEILTEFEAKVKESRVALAFKLQWTRRTEGSNMMSYEGSLSKINVPCIVYDEGTRGHNGEVIVLIGDNDLLPTGKLTDKVAKMSDTILVAKVYVKTILRTSLLFIGRPLLPSKTFEGSSYLFYINKSRDQENLSKNLRAQLTLENDLNQLLGDLNVEGDENDDDLFAALG